MEASIGSTGGIYGDACNAVPARCRWHGATSEYAGGITTTFCAHTTRELEKVGAIEELDPPREPHDQNF